MNRFKSFAQRSLKGITIALLRFPLTILSLAAETVLVWTVIQTQTDPGLPVFKWMFILAVSAFVGVTAQVASERFIHMKSSRFIAYGLALLFIGGYAMIIWPSPEIDIQVGVRSVVAIFSMVCAYLWLPSYKQGFDFNSVALAHFKAAFTACLYALVLMLGLAAIIVSIDILLFTIDENYYGYVFSTIWIFFMPVYYLSLIPNFNSDLEKDKTFTIEKIDYPRLLLILVSYIAIPLISVYTLVLVAYFAKIAFTLTWPVGQLGPMILAYSIAGLVIYVLASRLDNLFTKMYQMIFPKVLIPVVLMQLVSVMIRLNAYGITESRYYLTLGGIFTLIIGIFLSIKPIRHNGMIALIAMVFALVSILPPLDAFTVSRNSQISRLETILEDAGMLSDGTLRSMSNADQKTKEETTNILNYLNQRSHLDHLEWLPDGFDLYQDFKSTFGFEPTYPGNGAFGEYYYVSLKMEDPIEIDGYDVLLRASVYSGKGTMAATDFMVGSKTYQLKIDQVSTNDATIAIIDDMGKVVVESRLYDFAQTLISGNAQYNEPKGADEMTIETVNEGYRLKIIFQAININATSSNMFADYELIVLIAVPK